MWWWRGGGVVVVTVVVVVVTVAMVMLVAEFLGARRKGYLCASDGSEGLVTSTAVRQRWRILTDLTATV